MNKYLKCCCALVLLGTAAEAAPLGGGNLNLVNVLAGMPMFTAMEVAAVNPVAVLEATGARLAGLTVSLPTFDSNAWQVIADMPQDLLKVLESAPSPVAAAAVQGIDAWDIPQLSMLAFAGGTILLLMGAVFGGALLKLSMEEARKSKGMRRRYAP